MPPSKKGDANPLSTWQSVCQSHWTCASYDWEIFVPWTSNLVHCFTLMLDDPYCLADKLFKIKVTFWPSGLCWCKGDQCFMNTSCFLWTKTLDSFWVKKPRINIIRKINLLDFSLLLCNLKKIVTFIILTNNLNHKTLSRRITVPDYSKFVTGMQFTQLS